MKINRTNIFAVLLLSFCPALTPTVRAAAPTTLPAVFAEHMVLQRDTPLPVWGRAEPGAAISVMIADQTRKTAADSTGAWSVKFEPIKASSTPIEMSVADSAGPVVSFHDVLVGDVWLASGQSNMELALKASQDGDAEIAKSAEPAIRLFAVKRTPEEKPQFTCTGQWELCGPQSAAKFSAVAYYFSREIHRRENVPIGMIGSYAGGTKIESWSRLDEFLTDPSLQRIGDELKLRRTELAQLQKRYTDETVPDWQKQHDAWEREVGAAFHQEMAAWNTAAATARASGAPLPPKPKPAQPEPKKPDPPSDNPHHLGNLYNGMIAPLVPYALKGTIWYQGESDADNPAQYRLLFPAMIADWRSQWNQPGMHDFPFLFVQLPNFVAYANSDWPGLRAAQAQTLTVTKNTAMAVAIDLGEDNNIHPKNKKDVAARLVLAAENIAYGHEDVKFEGPTFSSMRTDGNAIDVVFDHADTKLEVGRPPSADAKLAAFEIAGADGKFVAADAQITDAATVRVSSPQVARPAFVRYAWSNTPNANLYNSAGLPAAPFRTDNGPTTAAATEPMR